MKRVLLLLAVLLFSAGSGTMMAQQDKAAEKAAKKAEKEARKAAEEAENMALFEQAVQALNDKDFVLEADRVEFKRGPFLFMSLRVPTSSLWMATAQPSSWHSTELTQVLTVSVESL